MEPSVAIRLIEKGIAKSKDTHWADLRAGSGVFTKALATVLGEGNIVYAMDENEAALNSIENISGKAVILKMKSDFIKDILNLPLLDGILMANSLHYVKSKDVFVANLRKILKPEGSLLIVEYDTLTSNQWVPYPIDFASLNALMRDTGFSSVTKLAEHPSQYRQGNMYSVLVK